MDVDRQQRRNGNALNVNAKQNKNVQFTEKSKYSFSPSDYEKLQKQRKTHAKKPSFPSLQHVDSESRFSETEPESDVDSLYFNRGFSEESLSPSERESDFDVRASIGNLQKDFNKLTQRYVKKVQSHVDNTLTKMKTRDKKPDVKTKKKPWIKPKEAGDSSQPSEDVLKKMERMKKECYRKIEANLATLRNIDSVTDEFYRINVNN